MEVEEIERKISKYKSRCTKHDEGSAEHAVNLKKLRHYEQELVEARSQVMDESVFDVLAERLKATEDERREAAAHAAAAEAEAEAEARAAEAEARAAAREADDRKRDRAEDEAYEAQARRKRRRAAAAEAEAESTSQRLSLRSGHDAYDGYGDDDDDDIDDSKPDQDSSLRDRPVAVQGGRVPVKVDHQKRLERRISPQEHLGLDKSLAVC